MKSEHELLVVDDNPADVALAREALEASGYSGQISSVGDGAAALAFLGRRGDYAGAARPDLVLLDLNLPKRGGFAVLAAMKANPDLRRIPVVILSTSLLSQDIARSYDLGANCYLSKPGTLAEFFCRMKTLERFWFGSVSLPPRGEEIKP